MQTLLVAAFLAVAPTILYLIVLNWIDRYEKEPWTLLLAGVVLGAIVAPLASMAILGATGRGFELTPSFAPRPTGADPVVAFVEELVKGALLIGLVAWVRDEFDDVVDGIVYGAAVGAGFGAGETFIYAIGGVSLPPGTLFRLVVSGLDHALYTAVFGAVLGYAATLRSRNERLVTVALGLATAVLLHTLHDSIPTILSRLLPLSTGGSGVLTSILAELIPLLGILTLVIAIVYALRREAAVLRTELLPEVESGVISRADYDTITSRRGQLARAGSTYRAHGMRGVMTLRRLYATEGELAFQKRRLVVRSRRRPQETRTEDLRAEIGRLRQRLGGQA
jgi:RsiW-degrading membrane proteinase PrsW (M82 family)